MELFGQNLTNVVSVTVDHILTGVSQELCTNLSNELVENLYQNTHRFILFNNFSNAILYLS